MSLTDFIISAALIPSQLVGTALLILVKAELTAVIRNVEGMSRKVGSSLFHNRFLVSRSR